MNLYIVWCLTGIFDKVAKSICLGMFNCYTFISIIIYLCILILKNQFQLKIYFYNLLYANSSSFVTLC